LEHALVRKIIKSPTIDQHCGKNAWHAKAEITIRLDVTVIRTDAKARAMMQDITATKSQATPLARSVRIVLPAAPDRAQNAAIVM